jgi:hypothetical protein
VCVHDGIKCPSVLAACLVVLCPPKKAGTQCTNLRRNCWSWAGWGGMMRRPVAHPSHPHLHLHLVRAARFSPCTAYPRPTLKDLRNREVPEVHFLYMTTGPGPWTNPSRNQISFFSPLRQRLPARPSHPILPQWKWLRPSHRVHPQIRPVLLRSSGQRSSRPPGAARAKTQEDLLGSEPLRAAARKAPWKARKE